VTARVEQHPATAHVHGLALTVDATCAVITCDHDGCGALYVHDVEATAVARERGWTSVHERDGCQAHPVACDDAAPDAARERGR
jgi:hypothetical protein